MGCSPRRKRPRSNQHGTKFMKSKSRLRAFETGTQPAFLKNPGEMMYFYCSGSHTRIWFKPRLAQVQYGTKRRAARFRGGRRRE